MSTPLQRLYARVAPLIALLTILAAFAALVFTYTNGQNDLRDNARRDRERSQLLGCFDRFATALAGGLPPVRKASAARDDVLLTALTDGLQNLLVKALAQDATPADARRLLDQLRQLQAAQDTLQDVRDENPYPPPPSEFCNITTD